MSEFLSEVLNADVNKEERREKDYRKNSGRRETEDDSVGMHSIKNSEERAETEGESACDL